MKIKVNCFWIVLIGLLSVLMNGCAKDNEHQDSLSSEMGFASLSIVNAVPNSVRMEAFLRDQKFNTTDESLSYGRKTTYRNVYSGKQMLSLTNHSSSDSEILNKELDLVANKIYSVFIFRDKTLQMIQSEDQIVKPASGKAKVRVVNLSPDIKPSDIRVNDGAVHFAEVGFKTITAFEEVDVAGTVPLTIRNTTQNLNITGDLKPVNQGIYTILIQGLVNPTTEGERLRTTVLKQ